ncbi:Brain acid soluble protein 1 [Tupaia chinensis]|uniref:Brain acid soluble protein 1 n=1 Tax=Tupaia chinensis TaxID=246437 RepID=L9JAN2_TUPCH|nr:Brain acid soluble protein 1 [Tupaia chinensis]
MGGKLGKKKGYNVNDEKAEGAGTEEEGTPKENEPQADADTAEAEESKDQEAPDAETKAEDQEGEKDAAAAKEEARKAEPEKTEAAAEAPKAPEQEKRLRPAPLKCPQAGAHSFLTVTGADDLKLHHQLTMSKGNDMVLPLSFTFGPQQSSVKTVCQV